MQLGDPARETIGHQQRLLSKQEMINFKSEEGFGGPIGNKHKADILYLPCLREALPRL